MATDIQVGGINLQSEIESNQPAVAGITLQVETGIPDIQVAGVSLQVEVEWIEAPPVTTHTVKIELLMWQSTEAAEAGTGDDVIVITDHGLVNTDFIVNKSLRDRSALDDPERCCRKVNPDASNIYFSKDLVGSLEDDEIMLFKWVDITEYLLQETLTISLKANHSDTATFQIMLPNEVTGNPDWRAWPGQYVRIYLDDVIRFCGIVSDYSMEGVNELHPYVYETVNCVSLKAILSRRTIAIDYAKDAWTGSIVGTLNDAYLVPEGLNLADGTAYVENGVQISERWNNDCISLADVFDECAAKAGYQWFIDASMQLWYIQDQDPPTAAPYDLDDSGLIRFRNLVLNHSIDNYINKVFVIGGKDANGNQIRSANLDILSMNATQEVCAGTGVYGTVIRDGALTKVLSRTAEAGTGVASDYTIQITDHGLVSGDYVYNKTLGQIFWVNGIVDDDYFTVYETIYTQTPGDVIVTFPLNDDAGLNLLKRQKYMPKTVEYTIDHIFLDPQMQQIIDLPTLGIDEGYYNIDSVTIKALKVGYYESRVVAILRDENDFSTQAHPDFRDYYRGF
jgi:hypothetical protein